MPFVASALITGGSSGLGYAAARFIAEEHPDWRILLASRNGAQAATTINDDLKRQDPGRRPNVFFLALDCSSLKDVRRFAQLYSSTLHPPLAALVLNAGIQVVSKVHHSQDGIELTFATNHVGQALLFFLLQDHLLPNAHIIYTSSGLHNPKEGSRTPKPVYVSAEKCAHPDKSPHWATAYEGRRRYALSKLANVLWVYALRQRAKEAGKTWTVAALSPGLVPGTGLARDASLPLRLIWTYILPHLVFLLRMLIPNTYTPNQAGRVLANLATKEDLVTTDEATAHWCHDGPIPSSVDSYSADKQADLWDWTVEAVATSEDERRRFSELQR